jgi:hypothetical protein
MFIPSTSYSFDWLVELLSLSFFYYWVQYGKSRSATAPHTKKKRSSFRRFSIQTPTW